MLRPSKLQIAPECSLRRLSCRLYRGGDSGWTNFLVRAQWQTFLPCSHFEKPHALQCNRFDEDIGVIKSIAANLDGSSCDYWERMHRLDWGLRDRMSLTACSSVELWKDKLNIKARIRKADPLQCRFQQWSQYPGEDLPSEGSEMTHGLMLRTSFTIFRLRVPAIVGMGSCPALSVTNAQVNSSPIHEGSPHRYSSPVLIHTRQGTCKRRNRFLLSFAWVHRRGTNIRDNWFPIVHCCCEFPSRILLYSKRLSGALWSLCGQLVFGGYSIIRLWPTEFHA